MKGHICLNIEYLLFSTFNHINSVADDCTFYANIQYMSRLQIFHPELNRRWRSNSYSMYLQIVLDWGNSNLVSFNASKTLGYSFLKSILIFSNQFCKIFPSKHIFPGIFSCREVKFLFPSSRIPLTY